MYGSPLTTKAYLACEHLFGYNILENLPIARATICTIANTEMISTFKKLLEDKRIKGGLRNTFT
jgi:hypothetical protein